MILNAQFKLLKGLIQLIQQEKSFPLEGKPARIIAKVNALTDPLIIRELYCASQSGAKIDLIVQDLCCPKPGVPSISENIRVVSIIGRLLEHSRVFYFVNNTYPMYCSNADLMKRNLQRRIEIAHPVLMKKWVNRTLAELELYLADKKQSWELMALTRGWNPVSIILSTV